MGVSFYQGTFNKLSGNGTQNVTVVPFTPKALIFWTSTMSGTTILNGWGMSYGFSDGTNNMVVGTYANDNTANSQSGSVLNNTVCIFTWEPGGVTAGVAAVTSLNSDGFTLNWTSSTATTYLIHFIAIGGTDITDVKTGMQTIATAVTGNKSYTPTTFKPDFLLTANEGWIAAAPYADGTNQTHNGIGVSCMKSPTDRWATMNVIEGGRANSDSWRYRRSDKCFSLLNSTTGAVAGEADFVSFDSTGWTWNYSTTAANITNSKYIYLAIKGGAWDVGSSPVGVTGTTTRTINTNISCTLKGVGFAFAGLIGTNNIPNGTAIYSLGGTDGTRQSCITCSDLTAAATMANVKVQKTDAVVYGLVAHATPGSSSEFSKGSISAFTATSFTTSWTSIDNNAYEFHYFAVLEPPAVVDDAVVKTKVITFAKSNNGIDGTKQDIFLPFTPKAIILMSSGGTLNATVEAHYNKIIGFSDGTTPAVHAISSEDNSAVADAARTTQSGYCWIDLSDTAPTTTFSSYGNAEFSIGKVTFTWTENSDAQATQITMWAIGGTGIQAKVNTVQVGRNTSGTQNYTGLGFTPQGDGKTILFMLGSGDTSIGPIHTGALSAFGCTTGVRSLGVDSGKQWYICTLAENGSDPTDTYSTGGQDRNFACMNLTGTGFIYYCFHSAWITDGFTLHWDGPPASSSTWFSYLVIDGVKCDSGTLNSPTVATNNVDYSVSVGGSTIKGLMLASTFATTLGGSIIGYADYVLGVTDGTNTSTISAVDEDGQATSDSYRYSERGTKIVNAITADGSAFDVANFDSFSANNFRLDWTTKAGIAYRYYWLVIAEAQQIISKDIGDTYNVTDAITRLATRTRAIGDTYSVSDSVATIVNHVKNVGDTYNVSDTVTRAQVLVRAIGDTFSITDAVARAQTLTRLLEDSYSISDAVTRTLSILKSIGDTYDVTDQITRLVSFQRLLEDTYNITDALTKSQILTRNVIDSYDVTDAVTRLLTSIKNLGDTYNISDTVERAQVLVRLIEDTFNITDSVNRVLSIFKEVADNYNISDAVTRSQDLTRTVEDNYNISDSVDRFVQYFRSIADTYNITDNVSNAAAFNINLEDEYEISDSVTRSQQLTRTLADSYSVTDLVTRLLVLTRLVEDTYNINDSVIRQALLNRIVADTFNITDEVDFSIITPGEHHFRNVEDTYNISDSITREQILQRLLEESYNITDSIQKEGGQVPIVVDEHLQIKGGSGSGLGQLTLDKMKKRMIHRVVMDLLPESFPDKIYINNQKAFFLNDQLDTKQKVPEIRLTNKVEIREQIGATFAPISTFNIKNGIVTTKEVKDKQELRIAIKQMNTNDYALKQFIQNHIPRTIKINNLDGLRITNQISSSRFDSNINITNPVIINDIPTNKIANHLLVIDKNNVAINITSKILLQNTQYNNNFNIKNTIQISNLAENRVSSLVQPIKKYSMKEIKNILLNKSSVTYDKLISNIVKKTYTNTDEKEQLYYYLSNYQTRFDIEKTKTNREMDKLDKKYADKLEILYSKIAEEYRNDLPNLWKAKDKYGREIYDDIRIVAQKGYNLGIDYVSRATERDDIYVTQKDLDNVKEATEKSYNHFWESVEKNIKKKQIRLAYEEVKKLQDAELAEAEQTQQNQNVTPIIDLPKDTIKEKPKEYLISQREDPDEKPSEEITSEMAMILLMKSLTTSIVALATMDKLFQMNDILTQQNIQIKYIFATERDAAVCKYCLVNDYRLTHMEYTPYNVHLLPKPPVHFNCRCRILLKIGNSVIVK